MSLRNPETTVQNRKQVHEKAPETYNNVFLGKFHKAI